MWYKSENGNNVKPEPLDVLSSRKYVYVRRDFVLVPAVEGDGMDGRPEHWEWMETTIPKEDWEIYAKAMEHDTAFEDVYTALAELAGMIEEG